jgi:hypothetical protein
MKGTFLALFINLLLNHFYNRWKLLTQHDVSIQITFLEHANNHKTGKSKRSVLPD